MDQAHPEDADGELAAELTEVDEEPDEDEFDPFADHPVDPPPDYEGDDRAHEGEE